MISSERRCSSSERTRPSSSVSENMRIWASGVRSSWDTPDTKSVRRRASSYSRCSWTNAVTISPVVSASTPSSTGSRERGRPPITSFDAISGRSATWTCIPPIIASTVSRAENVAGYCTGERYSSAPFASVTITETIESNTIPPVSGREERLLLGPHRVERLERLRVDANADQRAGSACLFLHGVDHRVAQTAYLLDYHGQVLLGLIHGAGVGGQPIEQPPARGRRRGISRGLEPAGREVEAQRVARQLEEVDRVRLEPGLELFRAGQRRAWSAGLGA